MNEAEAKAGGRPRGRLLGSADHAGTVPAAPRRRAEDLLRIADDVAYWLAVAPLAARLPASLAYRVASWRGDCNFWYRARRRSEAVRNLRQVLGDELSPEQAERLARECFRMISCEAIDVMRLRGRALSQGKLVEIRGRENLAAALAEGRGAILCTAHGYDSNSAFSVLHASGFPIIIIGRQGTPGQSTSSAKRRFWNFVYFRRVRRHRQRPNIEPWPGRVQVAAQAAVALRANEVVTISSDAPPLFADPTRTVQVPFLGRQARLLPGVVTLAQLTGAPVLMTFVHRSADYRRLVLEISPPLPMHGETAEAFGRCVAAIDAAIRESPAQWAFWLSTHDLLSLGLLPAAGPAEREPGDPNGLGKAPAASSPRSQAGTEIAEAYQ